APRRVLLVVGHRPLIVAGGGTLQDELLRVAGGGDVAAHARAGVPPGSMGPGGARGPRVLLGPPVGHQTGGPGLFAPPGTVGGREPFAALGTVPAVRDGRIVPLSADTIFRAGPRVGEAAATLAAAIHPEVAGS